LNPLVRTGMALVVENESWFVLHLVLSQKLGKGVLVERFHEVLEVPAKSQTQLQSPSLWGGFEVYSIHFIDLLASATTVCNCSLRFLVHG
jgi:hypothetical protein